MLEIKYKTMKQIEGSTCVYESRTFSTMSEADEYCMVNAPCSWDEIITIIEEENVNVK